MAVSNLYSQDRATLIMISNRYNMSPENWTSFDVKVIDSTMLECQYNMLYVADKTDTTKVRSLMKLQVGSFVSKFYPIIQEMKDNYSGNKDINESLNNNSKWTTLYGTGANNGEVWSYSSGVVKERFHSWLERNQCFEYEEPTIDMEWVITNQTKEIHGYHTILATTHFRGREWDAWFTMDIPVNTGPWKLRGLPGLILEASDKSGEYLFSCVGLSKVSNPINYYEVKNTVSMTRKKWRQYAKNLHEHPYDIFAQGSSLTVIVQGERVNTSWTIPYNPIELE